MSSRCDVEYDVDPKKQVAAHVFVKGDVSYFEEERGALVTMAKVRTTR